MTAEESCAGLFQTNAQDREVRESRLGGVLTERSY
jgi:hypothetical protein